MVMMEGSGWGALVRIYIEANVGACLLSLYYDDVN
jgi:hypothetical protein